MNEIDVGRTHVLFEVDRRLLSDIIASVFKVEVLVEEFYPMLLTRRQGSCYLL